MVKSSLATEVYDFGTKNSNPRNQKVCRITIHHMAGLSCSVYIVMVFYKDSIAQLSLMVI